MRIPTICEIKSCMCKKHRNVCRSSERQMDIKQIMAVCPGVEGSATYERSVSVDTRLSAFTV